MKRTVKRVLGMLLILSLAVAMIPLKTASVNAAPGEFTVSGIVPATYDGVAMSMDLNTKVSGGTPPYEFEKLSGPDWLNLSIDGMITGTPESPGANVDLVFKVTDSNGSASDPLTITVDETYASNPVVFTDSDTFDIPENTVGTPITSFSVAGSVSGGTPPYWFDKYSLGPGWIEVSEDGTISGTPDFEQRNEDLIVRVTDSNGLEDRIAIQVGNSVENDGRTIVTKVTGTTSDSLADICAIGNDATKYIAITTDTVEPSSATGAAYIESELGWQRKVGDEWVWFDDPENPISTFEPGIWRYVVHVCIDEFSTPANAAETTKLSLGVELEINGEAWTLDDAYNGYDEETHELYCYAIFVSQEFHPGAEAIHSVKIKNITKPAAGANATLSGITLDTEHVVLESVYWARQYHSDWIEMSEDEIFQETGNYALRTIVSPEDGYYIADDVEVTYNGQTAHIIELYDDELLSHLVFPLASATDALYVVTAGALNIRSGSNTSANRVGGLKYGDVIQAKAESDGWVLIEKDGITGWVNRSYLALTYSEDTAFEDGPVYYEVAAGEMNVREDISTDSTRIGGVSNGKQVLATGVRTNEDGTETWIVVDYYDSVKDEHTLAYILFSKKQEGGNTTYYFTGTETPPTKETAKEDDASEVVQVSTGGVSPTVWLDTGDSVIELKIATAAGSGQSIDLNDEMVTFEEEGVFSTTFYSDDAHNFSSLTQENIQLQADSLYEVKSFSVLEGGIAVKLFLTPKDPVKITFESNGGSEVPSMTIARGQTAPSPTDPEKEEHTFAGWYTDEALTSAFDFESPVTETLTLYAKYTSDISYSFSKGADATWTKGSTAGVDLTVNRNRKDDETFTHFKSIEIDGTVLDASAYTAASGSLNATLNASYLETLSEGSHALKVNFDDGSAETTLTVAKKAADVPGTGDQNRIVLWFGAAVLSLAGIASAYVLKKKCAA